MGIREEHIIENTKNIKMELEVKDFAEIGYWIRDLKIKMKKFELLKIRLRVDIDYFHDGIERENKYLDFKN